MPTLDPSKAYEGPGDIPDAGVELTHVVTGNTQYFHMEGVQVRVCIELSPTWIKEIATLTEKDNFTDIFFPGETIILTVKPSAADQTPRFKFREG